MDIASFSGESWQCCSRRAWFVQLAFTMATALTGTVNAEAAKNRGVCWRMSRGKRHFLLVGGLHTLRKSDLPIPEIVAECYHEASALVMETIPYERALKANQQQVSNLGRLSSGKSLQHYLGEETLALLQKFLKSKPHLSSVLNFKPWLAYTMIQRELELDAGFDEKFGLESFFAKKASVDGKPMSLLESVTESLAAVDGLPTKIQVHMLTDALQAWADKSWERKLDQIATGWKQGDPAALMRFLEVSYDLASASEFETRLVFSRNKRWAQRLAEMDFEGTKLVCVGVQHLLGPGSLVAELIRRGYNANRL
jgi:uncharacterized protein YbaP (TraB family)